MNQPTEDRIKKIEERLEKLEQQQTEPMSISDTVLLQTIMTMVGQQATNVGVLQHEMAGARADILKLRETQADHGDLLKALKATMATKDDVNKLEKIMLQILDRLPQLEGE